MQSASVARLQKRGLTLCSYTYRYIYKYIDTDIQVCTYNYVCMPRDRQIHRQIVGLRVNIPSLVFRNVDPERPPCPASQSSYLSIHRIHIYTYIPISLYLYVYFYKLYRRSLFILGGLRCLTLQYSFPLSVQVDPHAVHIDRQIYTPSVARLQKCGARTAAVPTVSIYLSIYLPYTYLYLYTYIPTYLYIYLSIFLYRYTCNHRSSLVFQKCETVSMTMCPSIYLSIHPYLYLYTQIYIYVCMYLQIDSSQKYTPSIARLQKRGARAPAVPSVPIQHSIYLSIPTYL